MKRMIAQIRVVVVMGAGLLSVASASAETFTDNFNRADVSATTNIGPGWLHGSNATGPAYMDHWSIISSELAQGGLETAPSIYCTNISLLNKNVYAVSIDVKGPSKMNHLALFANQPYMSNQPSIQALYTPGIDRIMLRVVDPDGTMHDYPSAVDTDLAVDVWYTFSLQRSNEFARVTMTGTNVAMDTGWVSSWVRTVPYTGYAGLWENANYHIDNFALTAETVPQSQDGIFNDDFNRPDGTSTNLGPGWLSATNTIGFPWMDRWAIASQTAARFDGGSSAWATNIILGKIYQIGMDLQYTAAGAFNGWGILGNCTYMGSKNYINAIHQPGLKRIFLRVWDSAGGMEDLPSYPAAASLTDGAWYRFALYRSNSYVRSTFVGVDANLDTGWLTSSGMAQMGRGGYAGVAGNNWQSFDNFAVSNKFLAMGTTLMFK